MSIWHGACTRVYRVPFEGRTTLGTCVFHQFLGVGPSAFATIRRGERPMAIERWDPFSEAVSLRDAVNSLFQDSFVRPRGFQASGAGVGTFPIDVRENENDYVIHASLPGIKPDDVQITVHGDTLTIRGELKDEEEKKGEHWHIHERRA